MAGDFWRDAYTRPPLSGLRRCDETDVFAWVAAQLPVAGTAVDWSKVDRHHTHQLFEDDAELRTAAAEAILLRLTDGQRARHGGDSLSPWGVWLDSGSAGAEAIRALLEIPEHHYVLAEDRSWLVVVRMEGDLDVLDLRT